MAGGEIKTLQSSQPANFGKLNNTPVPYTAQTKDGSVTLSNSDGSSSFALCYAATITGTTADGRPKVTFDNAQYQAHTAELWKDGKAALARNTTDNRNILGIVGANVYVNGDDNRSASDAQIGNVYAIITPLKPGEVAKNDYSPRYEADDHVARGVILQQIAENTPETVERGDVVEDDIGDYKKDSSTTHAITILPGIAESHKPNNDATMLHNQCEYLLGGAAITYSGKLLVDLNSTPDFSQADRVTLTFMASHGGVLDPDDAVILQKTLSLSELSPGKTIALAHDANDETHVDVSEIGTSKPSIATFTLKVFDSVDPAQWGAPAEQIK